MHVTVDVEGGGWGLSTSLLMMRVTVSLGVPVRQRRVASACWLRRVVHVRQGEGEGWLLAVSGARAARGRVRLRMHGCAQGATGAAACGANMGCMYIAIGK